MNTQATVEVKAVSANPRIVSNPRICGGEPTVRGTRIQAWLVLSFLGAGDDEATILENFPSLTHEDILACLGYAAELATEKAVTV